VSTLFVEPGAWRRLPEIWDPSWRRAAVIGDHGVISRFAAILLGTLRSVGVESIVASFPPGEASKTRETWGALGDRLLEAGIGRDDVVIGLGGGVSLDLAGFVAATHLRGVETVYLPTTLLAQVDAAIGGKTGVNTARGKNLVGAFHPPRAILSDPRVCDSLPEVEWRNGLAELVKTAVIADASLVSWIEEAVCEATPSRAAWAPAIARAAHLKTTIVDEDPGEGGRRAVLNFGHTVGHAIEAASKFRVPHGQAVATGMVVEAALACRLLGFPVSTWLRIRTLLTDLGIDLLLQQDAEPLLDYMSRDKKNRSGSIHMALPNDLGRMEPGDGGWTVPVDEGLIREVLARGVGQ